MKNQISLLRVIVIMNLVMLPSASSLFAAEFIQMKAQGYQPVVTPEEANRRVELGLDQDKMILLEDGGTGRRTYLEKAKAAVIPAPPAREKV